MTQKLIELQKETDKSTMTDGCFLSIIDRNSRQKIRKDTKSRNTINQLNLI